MKLRLLIFILVIGILAIAVGWIYESRLRAPAQPARLEIPDNIDYFLTAAGSITNSKAAGWNTGRSTTPA